MKNTGKNTGFIVLVMLMLASPVVAGTYNGLTTQNLSNEDIIVNITGTSVIDHTGKISGSSSLTLQSTVNGPQKLSGTYTFTGPITVNSGRLQINASISSISNLSLVGGDAWVLKSNAISGLDINVPMGRMLSVEGQVNTLSGSTVRVTGGKLILGPHHNTAETTNANAAVYIAGNGGGMAAIYANSWKTEQQNNISVGGTITLTDDATIGNNLMNVGQFIVNSAITGSHTLTYKDTRGASDANFGKRIINLKGDNSGFSGDIVVDGVKLYMTSENSVGTGENITVKDKGALYVFTPDKMLGKTILVENGTMASSEEISNAFKGANVQVEQGGTLQYYAGTTKDPSGSDTINLKSAGLIRKSGHPDFSLYGSILMTGDTTIANNAVSSAKRFDIYAGITGSDDLTVNTQVADAYVNFCGDSLKDFEGTLKFTGAAGGYSNLYGSIDNVAGVEVDTITVLVGDNAVNLNNISGTGELRYAGTNSKSLINSNDTVFTGLINTRGADTADPNRTVTKKGAGTLTIQSTQDQLGDFVVEDGKLNLDGTIDGSLQVLENSIFSPGTVTDVGAATVTGNLEFTDGAILSLDILDFNTNYDTLNIMGTTNFQNGSILTLDLPSAQLPSDAFDLPLLNYTGAVTGSPMIASNPTWFFTLGEDGILHGKANPNAVPEPATWILWVLGLGVIGFYRNRK